MRRYAARNIEKSIATRCRSYPESGAETSPYKHAINSPLVDATQANSPTEIAAGTHEQTNAIGLQRLARGEVTLTPVEMQVGDVMIRAVRGLHRGTPNTTHEPRPMVVIGYSGAGCSARSLLNSTA